MYIANFLMPEETYTTDVLFRTEAEARRYMELSFRGYCDSEEEFEECLSIVEAQTFIPPYWFSLKPFAVYFAKGQPVGCEQTFVPDMAKQRYVVRERPGFLDSITLLLWAENEAKALEMAKGFYKGWRFAKENNEK